MTIGLICQHLGSNNHRKMTYHLHFIRGVWSYAFALNQAAGCPWFCFCHHVSARSLAVWSAFPLIHVTFKEEMINMWLQVGSRGKPAMAENDTSRTVSNLLVWSICWAFLCMVSWQMEGFDTLVLEQALQTADYSTSQSFVSTTARTNWINLSPTKVGVVLFSLIFPACKSV